MLRWLLPAVLAGAALTVSCVKEQVQDPSDALMADMPVLTATTSAGSPATKASLDASGQEKLVVWDKGDAISVFYHNTTALKYALEGEGGSPNGNFLYASGFSPAFMFPEIYAAYPYDKATKFDGAAFTLKFPAEQNYTEGGFDPKANLMVAATSGEELYFRNVGGYLVIPMYGEEVSVEKVEVTGCDGEPLAGLAEVYAYEDDTPDTWLEGETSETVTLTADPAVAVGASADAATEFWFVLPPTDFYEGLTVKVTDTEGNVYEATADVYVGVERNAVFRLAPLELTLKEPEPELTVDMFDKIEVPASATSVELPYTASEAVTVKARVLSGFPWLSKPKDLTTNPLVGTLEANESNYYRVGEFEFTFTDADGNSVTRLVAIIQRADIRFNVEASHDHIVFDKECSSVVVTFTGTSDCSIAEFDVRGWKPDWMKTQRMDNWEANEPIRVIFYPKPNTTSETRTGLCAIKISTNEDPYESVIKVVTFEQAPGAQAEPSGYTFSVPNTTIKVNNALQTLHVPFISTVAPSPHDIQFEITDSPSWIRADSMAPMMFRVSANNAEGASERNAQVNYTYTDPNGVEHTGSFRVFQSATKSIE